MDHNTAPSLEKILLCLGVNISHIGLKTQHIGQLTVRDKGCVISVMITMGVFVHDWCCKPFRSPANNGIHFGTYMCCEYKGSEFLEFS